MSRSDLRPPVVTTTATGSLAGLPEYVFLGNKPYKGPTGVGQEGLLIARRDGDITWFSPVTSGQVLDFNVQTYKGKSVLTWWHGATSSSYGQGTCYIADSSYSVIATVKAGKGLRADLHEFKLTTRGTALVDAYQRRGNVNLTSVGVNAIDVAADGDLLVSSRNTCTIYKIGRRDGRIKWRLGGKKSSFTLGAGVPFHWQHHVRAHGPNRLTLFDNGSSPALATRSRGLLLQLDTAKMHASRVRAFTSPAGLLAAHDATGKLIGQSAILRKTGLAAV